MTKHLQKFTAILIAVIMTLGVFAVVPFTASAAGTDEDSVVVAADQASEVGAESSTEVGSNKVIYFDVKSAGWNTKSVWCHIWRADGTGDWPAWSTKAEKCTYDKETGIATYDIQTAIDRNFKMDIDDTKSFCVIFACDAGQTYNAIMSGKCFGDTLYCESSEQVENPMDSEKKCYIAVWKKNKDCGPQKIITSTGEIVGNTLAEGTTDVTLVADHLISYYTDYLISYYNYQAKLDNLQKLINKLNVSPSAVMEAVANKEAGAVKSGSKKQADVATELEAIATVVGKLTNPDNTTNSSLGDIDGDGKISVNDVTDIQKYIVQLKPFTDEQMKFADVDKNGKIDVYDVTLLQKVIVKMVSITENNSSNNSENQNQNNSATDDKNESSVSEYEKRVVELVNEIRVENGLSPLTLNSDLSNVARLKSQDMKDKNYFDHISPTYGSPFDMMTQFGISYISAGENLANGYATPEDVVNGWMNSPGHRANILDTSFTQIGVGYVADVNYWTQMFIG